MRVYPKSRWIIIIKCYSGNYFIKPPMKYCVVFFHDESFQLFIQYKSMSFVVSIDPMCVTIVRFRLTTNLGCNDKNNKYFLISSNLLSGEITFN